MREKYESLPLSTLKELAKSRGIKGISAMKKAEVIEAMLQQDEKDAEIAALNGDPEPTPVRTVSQEKARRAAEQRKTEKKAEAQAKQRNAVASKNDTVSKNDTASKNAAAPKNDNASKNAAAPKNAVAPKNDNASKNAVAPQNDTASKSDIISKNDTASNGGTKHKSDAAPKDDLNQKTEGASKSESIPAQNNNPAGDASISSEKEALDSGVMAKGILEVMPDGYGFIRSDNYMPGENDVYVAPSQIRRFNLKTGDIINGNTRVKTQAEKFSALLYVKSVNGMHPNEAMHRPVFEDLTPIFPNERIKLEIGQSSTAMRIMDLISPVGKGQRGMIVSPPKAGKTTLLKGVAKSITQNYPEMHLIILLIDERPEEVTDIKESVEGRHVEVIYSTFDELPEHHKRVSEMVIERGKRLVEHGKDVIILLDSITRLARAYNLTVPPSGRTLSGGLDPAALHMPKRFFGAARNMREGGSLTILATALVDTGSKMDDVVYEEFKGTGNMEMILDRKLQEKRVFPAIDIAKSGTRREDLLLNPDEMEAINVIRKALNGLKSEESAERIIDLFSKTRNNAEFVDMVQKMKFI